jgi:hypothetical protein
VWKSRVINVEVFYSPDLTLFPSMSQHLAFEDKYFSGASVAYVSPRYTNHNPMEGFYEKGIRNN